MQRYRLLFVLLIFFTLVQQNHGASRPIKVGAIFHDGDEELFRAFKKAIADLKYENAAPAFDIQPVVKWINVNTDSFRTSAAACELAEEGVAAIFGPTSPYTSGIVASAALRLEIPHIDFVWRNSETTKPLPMTLNFYPNSEKLSQAIADIVDSKSWRSYAGIYETVDGLSRIQKALTLRRTKDSIITIRNIGEGPDYRPVLKEISNMSIFSVILDVEPEHIMTVLQQAKEVKLLADYCNFVITNLDSTAFPLLRIREGTTANITGLSILSNEDERIEDINTVESAILYDSVFLFFQAIETLEARNEDSEDPVAIDPVPLSCDDIKKYEAGPNITNLMRELAKEGKLTGYMSFDENGERDFLLNIWDIRRKLIHTGTWDTTDGLDTSGSGQELETDLFKSIEEKKFIITTRVGAPYVMEVTDSATRGILIENKRYEGYCIDLMEKISKILRFKYEFELVPGNSYGKYDAEKKTWTGLIKRLLDHKADLAICDLTITFERQEAVDFTMPFMNLGISILFSKPEEKVVDLFSFLSPLSMDVWMYMATAYLGVSIMLYLQARMAPGEWDNPHPCNSEPEELENAFDLKNSLWLTIGSLMQQGSDILPKAPSIRMAAGMWWFFTLIMVSSYTANLAAFLTVDKMEVPIKGVEDLAKQTKIKYGAVDGGSTSAFFKNSNYSTYQRMWAAMAEARPSVFTNDNDEGVDRVVKGKRLYAFLMESTTIEYKMERNCDIQKIGPPIDNKGYGIALPLNSPYRTPINGAILTLQEKGVLSGLKDKWWKKEGGGLCKKDVEAANSNELGLTAVGGVFLVLMFGCFVSLIIAICEFLWNIRKVAVEEKITPWEAMVAELKFAINISEETKPVKISKSRSSTGSIEGGLGRAASTARSMVGSFLRLDILDKIDKNNTNHSNHQGIN